MLDTLARQIIRHGGYLWRSIELLGSLVDGDRLNSRSRIERQCLVDCKCLRFSIPSDLMHCLLTFSSCSLSSHLDSLGEGLPGSDSTRRRPIFCRRWVKRGSKWHLEDLSVDPGPVDGKPMLVSRCLIDPARQMKSLMLQFVDFHPAALLKVKLVRKPEYCCRRQKAPDQSPEFFPYLHSSRAILVNPWFVVHTAQCSEEPPGDSVS